MSDLHALAAACGVAAEYDDHAGRPVRVSDDVLRSVLRALGAEPDDPDRALRDLELERWRRPLPPVAVARRGRGGQVWAHCPHGAEVRVHVELEEGGEVELPQVDRWVEPRDVDGVLTGEATFDIPADVPTGYHRVVATVDGRTATAPLIIAPDRLPAPEPAWGWAVQLYSTPSAQSWGHGDLVDLAELVRRAAEEHEAGFVLVNPLGAAAPVTPITRSPYFPSSRRFTSPLYLRVEALPEYDDLPAEARAAVDQLRLPGVVDGPIDRDAVWEAKRAALEFIWPQVRFDPKRREQIAAFRAEQGAALERFALWCALAERHGADWRSWPERLRHPASPEVAAAARELAGRVAFHCWVQLRCDEQLAAAGAAARAAAMPHGVMHDLPVGVDPSGADAWALQDALVLGATVGAPPDAFNQVGQDWSQPPWHPRRLAELGYQPFIEQVRALLRHAGALRVDHVLGMFRLWWVPEGSPPAEGTYVRYDADALLGILALEAQRASAALVGEDLGVVPPEVTRELADRGILGTTVLVFETTDDGPRPVEQLRAESLGAVVTHDMPTIAAWLEGRHVDLRAELGLLSRPVEEERAQWQRERDGWLDAARARGLEVSDTEQATLALHELLAAAPCRLRVAQLADAVGDVQVQNQPGTDDEHPNWQAPLADGAGRRILLEEALGSESALLIAMALGYGSAP